MKTDQMFGIEGDKGGALFQQAPRDLKKIENHNFKEISNITKVSLYKMNNFAFVAHPP